MVEVAELAEEWVEVPALSILEADGFDTVGAEQLFDSLAEPEWNGSIDFMACEDGAVTAQRTLFILQGPVRSWLGWNIPDDHNTFHLETATNEALRDLWNDFWT